MKSQPPISKLQWLRVFQMRRSTATDAKTDSYIKETQQYLCIKEMD